LAGHKKIIILFDSISKMKRSEGFDGVNKPWPKIVLQGVGDSNDCLSVTT
jgi:hypothetical protein